MSNIKSPRLRYMSRVVAGVFYAALLVFLFFYIKSINFSALGSVQFAWHFVIIASLFGLAMRYWQIVGWLVILKDLGAEGLERSRVQLAHVYAKSWLARYIPGTAPWILGKIYFASKHGVSKSKLAVSSLLEAVLQVTVVLAFGSLLLLMDERFGVIDQRLRIVMGVVLALCLIVVMPPVFNRLVGLAHRIARKKELSAENKMPAKTLLKGVALYVTGGVLYGLFLFFLAKGVYPPLAYDQIPFIIGAGNLAGALGILAIFTPSGLGVRDGVQLLLFSLVMPPEFALTITILTRLWDVVLDVLFFVVAWLVKLVRPSRAA